MNIHPVDSEKNLFSITDVYSKELIDKIQKLDLLSYPHKPVEWQEHAPRRLIMFDDDDILAQLNKENTANMSSIADAIGVPLYKIITNLWLDHSQFNMGIHLDNPGVDIAMQVYLLPNDISLGTKFYYSDDESQLRHNFPYAVNSGYIMINGPKQYHGIPVSVPANTLRCSTYSYLNRI